MPTNLPTVNDYQQIMQHPSNFLGDQRLKNCRVETDQLGMPRVRSGGFALTYRLENASAKWALRCFRRVAVERESRYAAICRYLSSHPSKILIPVEYLPQGVLCKGAWYPVTVMEWIEGDTLSNFIYKNNGNPAQILKITEGFPIVASEIERLKIAHGDLSHLNILVRNGGLVLIDYDGMFVPELKGQKSNELGNPHFQHPRRTETDFNSELDRFSEIVIYLSLRGLALASNLYNDYGKGGEGLIFKREDFINPQSSKLLNELEKLPGLQKLVQQFRGVCASDIRYIPRLSDLLENRAVELPQSKAPSVQTVLTNVFQTLDALKRGALLENEGEYVSVIGMIQDVTERVARNGLPYAKLNFGDWRRHCFTVVLWSEALGLLKSTGKNPTEFENKWVCVTGLLNVYRNNYGDTSQILLDTPSNIEIISENEASLRLSGNRIIYQAPEKQETEKIITAPTQSPQSIRVPIATVGTEKLPVTTPISPRGISTINPLAYPSSSVSSTPQKQPIPSQSTVLPTSKPLSQAIDISTQVNKLYPSDKMVIKQEPNTTTQPTHNLKTPKKPTLWDKFIDKIGKAFK